MWVQLLQHTANIGINMENEQLNFKALEDLSKVLVNLRNIEEFELYRKVKQIASNLSEQYVSDSEAFLAISNKDL